MSNIPLTDRPDWSFARAAKIHVSPMLERAMAGERSTARAAEPDPRPSREAARPIFVGRTDELAELRTMLGAVIGGAGQSLLISGDPGIGKTRLASEFTLDARDQGAFVLWGRCWEGGGAPPFWPWIEAIRQALGSEHLPSPPRLGRNGALVRELVPELGEGTAGEGETPRSSDPDSARFLLFDAIAQLFRLLSERVPTVVVIDDLQSADLASILLLTFLARHLRDARILLVGTFRQPAAALKPDHASALADLGRQGRSLPLQGLSAGDVGDLIEGTAGRTPSPSFVSRIHGVTDGNPFFVDEIVRLLVAEGRFDSNADTAGGFLIPDGVREAVRRRLQLTTQKTSALLEVAAVIGREFDAEPLKLTADSAPLTVLEALEESTQLGLLSTASGVNRRYQFRHALIREVLYERIPPARRLLLHRRAGEALEILEGTKPGHYVDELAHHFVLAAPAGGDLRFIEHGIRAARRSLAKMAFEEAAAVLERVLDATVVAPPGERALCQILLALGEAREWAHDIAGSRPIFERAAATARTLGDANLFVEAALGVGAVQALKFTAISRCDAAPELLLDALSMIAPDDARSRARLLGRLALHHLSSGERQAALEMSAKALDAARHSADPEALGQALIARNAVLFGPDFLEERLALADELVAVARRTRSRDFELRAQALTFTVRFEVGDLPAADAALEAHRELAEASGDPFERWANLVWQGERVLLEGRFGEAETFARRAFAISESTPGPHTAELYGPASFAGQIILINDDRDDADANQPTVEHFRARYPELSVWRVAHLLQITRAGEVDAVRHELESLTNRSLVDFDRNGAWLASMTYLTEAIELVGDRDLAALVLDRLDAVRDQHVTVSHVGSRGFLSRYRGLLNATLERWPEADASLRAAAEMHRRMRAHPHVARTLYDHARVLARQGNPDDRSRIDQFLGEASEIALKLGMRGLAARCRSLTGHLASVGTADFTADASPLPRLINTRPFWTLRYEDRSIVLKDAKGLTYLAALLAEPDREFRAIDLIQLLAPAHDGEGRGRSSSASPPIGLEVKEPLIDQKARRAYERRIRDLTESLVQSELAGDPAESLACREELTVLEQEMSRTVGLGGQTRTSSASERARSSVTRAIRLAIQQITAADAIIGAQIGRRVRTGTYCRYRSRDDRP